MNSPEAVIFDLDGVVRRWLKNDSPTGNSDSLNDSEINEVAFVPELLGLALTGAISDQEWRARIASGLSLKHQVSASLAREAVLKWSAATGLINYPVLEIVRRVRQVAKVALLTNATEKVLIDLQKLSLIEEFDTVMYSSALGYAKPSPLAYTAALSFLGSIRLCQI